MLHPPQSENHKAYLLKAAASGVIEAAHNLGVYYQHYRSPPDLKLSQEWYVLAADGGFPLSQVNLAVILKDDGKAAEAVKWLEKAQNQPGSVGEDATRLLKEMERSERV
jgi:TPR repeat protein